jgi:hypothetical protein
MASKCISKLARSRPPSASLSYSISASKCVSKPARSRPPSATPSSTRSRPSSASPNSLDHGLQMHLQTRSISASKCISELHDLQTRSITTSKCISEFNWISACMCVSKLARSRPPSTSPVHTITASKFISKFSQSRVSRCPCDYAPVPSAARLAVCIYIE